MRNKVDAEVLAYDLRDLKSTAHIMALGFESHRNELGVGCMNVIEARIEQIMQNYELDKELKPSEEAK